LETIAIAGFNLREVGTEAIDSHWLRGGFPPSYLAGSDDDSFAWRRNFLQTFLERDIPQVSENVSPVTMLRFWTMLAHYHGGVWNASEFARSMSITQPAVRNYLDILSGLFTIRQLQPWHQNLKKRQIRSPKVYL